MKVLARVRGAAVGSLSGAVSIAAHGMAGGGMPPSQPAVVLLLAACAGVGAAVVAVGARSNWNAMFLLAVLTVGQLVGHTTLTLVGDHAQSPGLSASMIAAHLVALGVSVALVRGVECACLYVLAAFTRVALVIFVPPPIDIGVWSATPIYRAKLSLWLLVGAAAGTRGPPSPA